MKKSKDCLFFRLVRRTRQAPVPWGVDKVALSAHKVLSTPHGTGACRCAFKAGGKKIRVKYFRHPDEKCLVCNIWYDGKTVRECIKNCQRCSMRERRWLFIGEEKFLIRRVRNYLFSVSDVVFTSLFESVSAGTIGG